MHDLVGSAFVLHFPAHRRRRRRGDEEELVGFGEREVLVAWVQGSVEPEVNADAAAHYRLAVEGRTDLESRVHVKEGCHDSAEGFQWRPGVDWCVLVYQLPHLDEVRGIEDLGFQEIGDDQCVRRRRGLDQRREV